MRFIAGQKVKIKKVSLNIPQDYIASALTPPYVATISHFGVDPHSGEYMYRLEECPWGWYECEIEGLYEESVPIENRFEILDL